MLFNFVELLFVHWFADFVVQTSSQAFNKSKCNWALARHVLTYTLTLALGSILIFGNTIEVIGFSVFNGILHWFTDYYTSRLTKYLYEKKDYHNFFVIIGLDQFIHHVTLAITVYAFFR